MVRGNKSGKTNPAQRKAIHSVYFWCFMGYIEEGRLKRRVPQGTSGSFHPGSGRKERKDSTSGLILTSGHHLDSKGARVAASAQSWSQAGF